MESLTIRQIAEKMQLDRDTLKRNFESNGLVIRENGKLKLTPKGIKFGGKIQTGVRDGEQYTFIVWTEKIYAIEEIFSISKVEEVPNDVDDTEGEDYIAEYFDKIGINFREQEPVNGKKKLTGDEKDYRIADFYLPDYGVYVEFAGLWNRSDENRRRYNFKKQIYINNNIPCVWLYPDNLGVIHFFFHRRLENVLIAHKLESKLRLYNFKQFWKHTSYNFVGVFIGAYIIYVADAKSFSDGTFLIGVIFTALSIYRPLRYGISLYQGRGIDVPRLNEWEND